MINQSLKKNQPLKVGRFGLGFKSVFHLTGINLLYSGRFSAIYIDTRRMGLPIVYIEGSKLKLSKSCLFLPRWLF